MSKDKKEINGVAIVKTGDLTVGVIETIKPCRSKAMQKVFEISYSEGPFVSGKHRGKFGPSPLRAIIRDLIYMDMLKKAHAATFFQRHEDYMTKEERRAFMEKYGVEIDPKKVDQQKDKKKGEKTAGVDDPNVNVPKDPDKGTEPFEKRPEED
jgi:hypothetical protein